MAGLLFQTKKEEKKKKKKRKKKKEEEKRKEKEKKKRGGWRGGGEEEEKKKNKKKEKCLEVRFGDQRGFLSRGRGRSFHVEGPKTEKAREPTVESVVRGI